MTKKKVVRKRIKSVVKPEIGVIKEGTERLGLCGNSMPKVKTSDDKSPIGECIKWDVRDCQHILIPNTKGFWDRLSISLDIIFRRK